MGSAVTPAAIVCRAFKDLPRSPTLTSWCLVEAPPELKTRAARLIDVIVSEDGMDSESLRELIEQLPLEIPDVSEHLVEIAGVAAAAAGTEERRRRASVAVETAKAASLGIWKATVESFAKGLANAHITPTVTLSP